MKEQTLIDYSTGVKQGDNLAPILFIIVMQFIVELLEKKNGEDTTFTCQIIIMIPMRISIKAS